MLIGAGHAAQVGKDSLADILVKNHGFTRLAFADALKQLVYETNTEVRKLVDVMGWEASKVAHPAAVRQPLVDVGNSARRILGEDVWVRAVMDQIVPGRSYILSDCRFINEIEWIKGLGGSAVRIDRPGFAPLSNVADQALVGYAGWDYIIENDGALSDLKSKVEVMLEALRD